MQLSYFEILLFETKTTIFKEWFGSRSLLTRLDGGDETIKFHIGI